MATAKGWRAKAPLRANLRRRKGRSSFSNANEGACLPAAAIASMNAAHCIAAAAAFARERARRLATLDG